MVRARSAHERAPVASRQRRGDIYCCMEKCVKKARSLAQMCSCYDTYIITSASGYANAKAMLLTCTDTMRRSSRRYNAKASALFSCAFCFDLHAPFGVRAFKLTPIMPHCPENMFLLGRTPCLMDSNASLNVVVSRCVFVVALSLSGLRRYGTVRCFMAI